MLKVLVTGANGYIGSHVVKELFQKKEKFYVVATDLSNSRLNRDVDFIKFDIMHDDIYNSVYSKFGNPDICIHLAWSDGFNHNSVNHINNLPFHYNFLINMVNEGLPHLAVAGSFREYGNYEGKASEEIIVGNPENLYALAKTTLKKALDIFLKDKSVCFQWLRPFTPYGDDYMNNSILSKILIWEKEGKETFPFTEGKEAYDYIHIDDLAKQIVAVISQKEINGIINLCSGQPVSLKKVVETFLAEKNLKIKPEFGVFSSRSYDSKVIYGDNTKIKKILDSQDLNDE